MRLNKVQDLRGIAVLLVTISHINYEWNVMHFNGSIGVDIFFVLSGYILTHSIINSNKTTWEFIKGRINRIFPLWLVVLLVMVLYRTLRENIGIQEILRNIFLLPVDSDMRWKDLIVVPGWTLSFEFVFYFLCATFLALRKTKVSHRVYFMAVNTLLITTVFLGYTTSLFLEFSLGVLLYIYEIRLKKYSSISLASLILLMLCIWTTDDETLFLIPRDTITGLGYSIPRFLVWGIPSGYFVLAYLSMSVKSNRVLNYLGDMSFSIYLCQFLVLGFVINVFNFSEWYINWLLVLIALYFVSKFSRRYIERIRLLY